MIEIHAPSNSNINRTLSEGLLFGLPETQRVRSIGHVLIGSETIDPEARRLECIALGLCTKDGIFLDLLSPRSRERAAHFASEGLARIPRNQFIFIHHGRVLVDPIAVELI